MEHKSLHKYVERVEAKHSRVMIMGFNFKTKVDIILEYALSAKSGSIDTPETIKEEL